MEGRGGEGAEVPAVEVLGLDDHEVQVLALDGEHLHGLEQALLGVEHDGRRRRSKVTGEVADEHTGPVDLAIVAGEEEVHVRAVADDGLVNGSVRGAVDRAGEDWLGSGQYVPVGRIGRRPVRERGGVSLVGEDSSGGTGRGCVRRCSCSSGSERRRPSETSRRRG
jgi:hypothetical protein